MECDKPLSPCPLVGGRENPADLRMEERVCRPQKYKGSEIHQTKGTRSDLSKLQNISRCVDVALRSDQSEKAKTRKKRH
jgi:hypothetical protein